MYSIMTEFTALERVGFLLSLPPLLSNHFISGQDNQSATDRWLEKFKTIT